MQYLNKCQFLINAIEPTTEVLCKYQNNLFYLLSDCFLSPAKWSFVHRLSHIKPSFSTKPVFPLHAVE